MVEFRADLLTATEERAKMSSRPIGNSIDASIADFPPKTQEALEEMRALMRATATEATESISCAIPAFDLKGRHLVHFAGYQKHLGFYPTSFRNAASRSLPHVSLGAAASLATDRDRPGSRQPRRDVMDEAGRFFGRSLMYDAFYYHGNLSGRRSKAC